MDNRQLTTAPAPLVSFDQQVQLAHAFAQSGLFGIKTKEQALALMALCEAEGLHPAVAVRDYHIIQGRPAMKAEAMLARFQTAGGKVKWLELSDTFVEAQFTHPAGGSVKIAWDVDRAKKAGLMNKDIWKKYTRAMLRSRVISEGIRTVFPGVVTGVYTPDEMQDSDALIADYDVSDAVDVTDAVDITPPDYPADSFKNNLTPWGILIKAGKKTPDQIINTVSSKYLLSSEQIKQINDLATDNGEES